MQEGMTEEGIVIEVHNGMAKVRAVRGTSCGSCASKSLCKPSSGSDTNVVIEAKNELGASVGEMVEVSMRSKTFLTASFIAYMVPLIGFFIGSFVGKAVTGSDPYAALSGILFMIIFYVGIWLYNKSALKDGKYNPVIISVKHP
ncbi:MAG: SoxR reducing system RseC family protein [Nitrospirae bacterium]|nr:SoxR reducing system RseC family protein [Nitrospirota bacterium]